MIRWLFLGLLIYMVYRMIRGMIFISAVQNEARKRAKQQGQGPFVRTWTFGTGAPRQGRQPSSQQNQKSVKDRLQSIEEADFEEVEPGDDASKSNTNQEDSSS